MTRQDAKDLIRSLQEQDFGVTSFAPRGIAGHVRFFLTIIRGRDLDRLERVIQENHRDAFVSVSDVRLAKQGHFRTGGDTYLG